MKKILAIVASMMALGVSAQNADYQWKMTNFHTDDNYQICSFSYDAASRLVAVSDSLRGEYNVIDSMTYDADGHLVRLSGWQRINGERQNVYYIDYTYDEAGRIASRTNYNNFDGDWALGGIYSYSYNPQGQLVLTTLNMGGMIYQKVEYSYDGDDCVQEVWYSYSFDERVLLPSEKYTTTYTEGRKTLVYDSVSDDGRQWSYYGKYTYIYDDRGNCTEYRHYDNLNNEVERSLYTYDAAKPMASTLTPRNPEMDRPRTYDNVDACVREAWYSLDVDHVLQYVCDYIYDYADIHAAVRGPVAAAVALYPNPASSRVTLSGLPEGRTHVAIYDLSGRLVSTHAAQGSSTTMDVSTLPSGNYIVRLSQGTSEQSLKLVKE